MQIAMTAKLNSGCLSRKVGAVITDSEYNILSLGWNDAPCGAESCIRRNLFDLIRNYDRDAYSEYECYNDEFREYLNKINSRITEDMRVFNINNNVILYWCLKSYSMHKEFKRYKATKETKSYKVTKETEYFVY